MLNSLMYKLCYYRSVTHQSYYTVLNWHICEWSVTLFSNVRRFVETDGKGFDRVRRYEIGKKHFKLTHFEEVECFILFFFQFVREKFPIVWIMHSLCFHDAECRFSQPTIGWFGFTNWNLRRTESEGNWNLNLWVSQQNLLGYKHIETSAS